uniref:GIY-YIG domain-containing protein n=1 Tax=Kalanchoe fedtschenkoi TaxID=63787 RepID=A0A7N0VB08_KALFE
MMTRTLSRIFPSVKIPNPNPSSKLSPKSIKPQSDSDPESTTQSGSRWSVYLILSTNKPIRTYVGVTTNISRRLRQHNGELKGGAKAARAGRPWICACLIDGFVDRSEACEFESRWKGLSKTLPRERKNHAVDKQVNNDASFTLLRHREAALGRVRASLDCAHLNIDWKLNH